MTFFAALLFLAPVAAQATTSVAVSETATQNRASAGGAVASATVSARILQPVIVRVRRDEQRVQIAATGALAPQAEHDQAGMLWIEFS